MKRLFTIITVFLLLNVFAFGNFFSSRIFEVKVGADVSATNNVFSMNDIMKKNLVIDLRKLADDCPDSGLCITAGVKPTLEMNLNIKSLTLGVSSGVDFYEKLEIGKGIFDFLGYGTFIGQPFLSEIKDNTEIFAYTQLDVGFNTKKFKLHVKPAVFLPALIIQNSGGYAYALNTEEGLINVSANMNMEIFTPLELTSMNGNITVKSEDDIINKLMKGAGFDLAGSLQLPIFSWFNLVADARVPIVPGHITTKYVANSEFSFESTVLGIGEGNNFTSKDPTVSDAIETSFNINRPLKATVYLDKDFMGKLLNLRAGVGLGLRRPFSDQQIFYPEYYVGLTVNILDIVKATVSTQYTDQVFIHQLGTTVSVRIVQLDLGASLQSASFKQSFAFAGFGAYAYVTVGF